MLTINQNYNVRLSIGVICYNQARFIRQSLSSIFQQDFEESYEVIICDDASTDDSISIIREFEARYPDRIRLNCSNQNAGPMAMAKVFHEQARGQYVCWMDGDDRWTFSNKLREQVDFLDQHPEYSGCFHDATIIHQHPGIEKGAEYTMRFHHPWKTYSQFNRYQDDFFPWDALQRKIIPTASLVFRHPDLNDFFRIYDSFNLSISWILHLWILKKGKFKYFNETWSEYLDHPDGFSKKYSLIDFKINNIKILQSLLDDDFYRHLKKDVCGALVSEHRHLLSIPEISTIGKAAFSKYLSQYQAYQKKFAQLEAAYFKENFDTDTKK